MKKLLVISCFIIILYSVSFGQVNVEHFDYPADSVLTVVSGFRNRTVTNAEDASISIVSPGLIYDGLVSKGNAARMPASDDLDDNPATLEESIVYRDFFTDSVAEGSVYMSALIQTHEIRNRNGYAGNYFFMTLSPHDISRTRVRLCAKDNSGKVQIGLAKSWVSDIDWSANLDYDKTYLIVIKYEFVGEWNSTTSDDKVSAYIFERGYDGVPYTEPATATLTARDIASTDLPNIKKVLLRQSTVNATVDGIILGKTWNNVVLADNSAIPDPAGPAKSFHVSFSSGDDSNAGSLEAPFKTIQKAASSMSPGDTCYIHAGTYYEMVRPANSGIESEPLVFTVYRDDEVVIHGGKILTGWTKHSENIYKVPVSENIKDLFADRQYMLWARHPNMPYDQIKGIDMCRPTLGTANPPAGIDWTGVTVFQRDKEGWSNGITKQNDYVSLPDNVSLGGWLMGVPGLIDSEGEWCWKDGILYFWPIGNKDPNTLLVEGKVRDCAFDLTNRNYIVLKKITVFGATINMSNSQNCCLDGCKVLYLNSIMFNQMDNFFVSKWDNCSPMTTNLQGKGILVGGSNNTLQNCEIAHSWSSCVSLIGSNNKVYNSHIYDANWGLYPGCAVIAMNGGGHIIRRNSLHDATSNIILHTNKFNYFTSQREPWYIDYNEIYNVGLASTDNGGIYCFMTDGVGSVISYNWIHDSYNGFSTTLHSGSGIYLDNFSMNFIVHHNVIWNVMNGATATGIRANNPFPEINSTMGFVPNRHQIYNNTMFNCRKSINSPYNDWNGNIGVPYWNETKVFNNILLQSLSFGNAMVAGNYHGNNPMFANSAQQNFRLTAGSPCINGGIAISGVTDGYVGSAPDIGAYEYGGVDWVPGHKAAGSTPTPASHDKMMPGLKVYPNPVSGELFIEPGQIADKRYLVRLISAKGEIVKTGYIDAGSKNHRLDLSPFKNGIYVLQLLSDNQIYTKKIIITK